MCDIYPNPGPSIYHGLSFFITNINSLHDKINLLQAEIDHVKSDIIGISETKLDASIQDKDVKLPSYSIVRSDRTRTGGGVALYLSDRVFFSPPLFTNNHVDIEFIASDIVFNKNKLRVCCMYRPPSEPVSWLEKFKLFLDDLCDTESDVFLFGDFNYDFFVDVKCKHFKHILSSFHLEQEVHSATRITETSKTLIDLFITRKTNVLKCTPITSLTPFSSDHCIVSACINLPIPCHAIRKTKWCLDEADYVGLGDSIRDYDWTFLDNDNQIFDTRSNRFIDTLTELFH